MPLESLFQLVETLKARIEEHGADLRGSEWLTRYALIDPLLRELGWDTSDPALVRPEYRSGSGRVDYALLADGSPAMMVEAKKLGTPLRDSVLEQGIKYCLMEGTNRFSVTDGSCWEIYETHKPVPIDEKRVVEFDLVNPSSAETCLKALALWRPSLGQVGPPPPPPPPPPIWQPLTEIGESAVGNNPPVEMLFPDNVQVELRNWRSLPIEVVRRLTAKGELSANDCPIGKRSTKHYIVHTEPVHSHGVAFKGSDEVNNLYIDLNHTGKGHVENTELIIRHVGQDPTQFKVRFA